MKPEQSDTIDFLIEQLVEIIDRLDKFTTVFENFVEIIESSDREEMLERFK